MTTYRADDRLHDEARYCFSTKIKDLALQLVCKSLNILKYRFSLVHIAARIARGYELCLPVQYRFVHLFAPLVSTDLKSAKSRSVIRTIASNEPAPLRLRIRFQFGVILIG